MGKLLRQINKGNNISDLLLKMIEDQRKVEIEKANSTLASGELEEKIDDIEKNYEFNKEKYDFIPELFSRDIKIQKKFIETMIYIDDKDLSNYNSLSSILTAGVILSKLENNPELLSAEELFLISSSMISVPIENYNVYGEILTNKELLDNIFSKTENEEEQLFICYDILNYCDLYADEENMHDKNIINDILNVISNFNINKYK